jgi:hypothetical protein
MRTAIWLCWLFGHDFWHGYCQVCGKRLKK